MKAEIFFETHYVVPMCDLSLPIFKLHDNFFPLHLQTHYVSLYVTFPCPVLKCVTISPSISLCSLAFPDLCHRVAPLSVSCEGWWKDPPDFRTLLHQGFPRIRNCARFWGAWINGSDLPGI